MDFEEK